MAQNWTDDVYAAGHVAATDLQNMENNFACLKSCFSGADAPSGQVAGMLWFDTDNYVTKQRNAGDSAWVGLMHGDSSQKIWIYRNAAMDGWVVTTTGDYVLAAKGGATYTTGAAAAGTWTQPTHTHTYAHTHTIPAHTHKWYENNAAGSNDQTYDTDGVVTNLTAGNAKTLDRVHIALGASAGGVPVADSWTEAEAAATTNSQNTSTTVAGGTVATWRPAAYVNTLQALDV